MKRYACVAILLAAGLPAAELTIRIPPVTSTLNIEEQPVAMTVWGSISGVHLEVDADLSDLQRQITPILRAQLNQDNRCGDRLSVEQAALSPAAPASVLRANLHYEKWGCAKAFGRELVKKLIGGNSTIQIRLTPVVENSDSVRMRAEVTSIEADGQLGEVLRSGSFGEALQEKIRKSVVSAVEKSTRLPESLPKAVRDIATLRSVQFVDRGEGRLGLSIAGEAQISAQQAQMLADQLKGK